MRGCVGISKAVARWLHWEGERCQFQHWSAAAQTYSAQLARSYWALDLP